MADPLRPKPSLFKLGLIAILPILLYLGFQHAFSWGWNAGTQADNKARRAFLAELPDTACLRADDILPLARAHGWATRREPEFRWCVSPSGITSWLRVTVEPPLPFSTNDENAQMFAFDAQGCAVDWSYTSCE